MLIIYLQAQKEDLSNKQHPKVSKLPPILCQATPTLLHALCGTSHGLSVSEIPSNADIHGQCGPNDKTWPLKFHRACDSQTEPNQP